MGIGDMLHSPFTSMQHLSMAPNVPCGLSRYQRYIAPLSVFAAAFETLLSLPHPGSLFWWSGWYAIDTGWHSGEI